MYACARGAAAKCKVEVLTTPVRESCDRARTGRGTSIPKIDLRKPLRLTKGQVKESGGASARFRWQPRSTAAALRACRRPRPPTWRFASGVNHRVTSPRWTSARSYAGQFPTRYFVVYLGCTLDFTSRSCPFGRHDGQGRDEHLFPRTNAAAGTRDPPAPIHQVDSDRSPVEILPSPD